MIGGFFRSNKALSEVEVEALSKKWEDAHTGPVARGFGIGEIGPEITWLDVTTIDSPTRRFVAGSNRGPIPPRPLPPPPLRRHIPRGRCASCGSSEWIERGDQTVCAYCRGAR